jgi:hypothetical protein
MIHAFRLMPVKPPRAIFHSTNRRFLSRPQLLTRF